ncbi:hypothetical protein K488DRAFT_29227, partial [Vararia minispora EC-137]
MHALLMGINDYSNLGVGDLCGSVADVSRVKGFLVNKLHVPEAHIRTLLNEEATQDRIMSCVKGLADLDTINMGDPILIFYAGHGGTLPKPPESSWAVSNSTIECLVAHDARYSDTEETWVEGVVPDLVFASLLHRLAEVKGDNITVILDCCHSVSGAR